MRTYNLTHITQFYKMSVNISKIIILSVNLIPIDREFYIAFNATMKNIPRFI